MAKRFKDTELWDKEWFMALPPKLKCLVQLVRDKCDLSGVWSPNWVLANNYVGEPVNEQDLLKIDEGNQFFKMPGGKIFCLGFIEFQYGELSEKSPVHRKILNLLATHKIDYKHPINRVEEKEEEKEEKVDTETEEEKVKGVPSEIEFLEHCKITLQDKYPNYEFSLKSKYQTWKDDGWKNGHGKKIKNWKNTINNTIPHLKPTPNGSITTESRNDRVKSVTDLKNNAEAILDHYESKNSGGGT